VEKFLLVIQLFSGMAYLLQEKGIWSTVVGIRELIKSWAA